MKNTNARLYSCKTHERVQHDNIKSTLLHETYDEYSPFDNNLGSKHIIVTPKSNYFEEFVISDNCVIRHTHLYVPINLI